MLTGGRGGAVDKRLKAGHYKSAEVLLLHPESIGSGIRIIEKACTSRMKF
ncbi:hypothetical protein [uncultured Desulfobacter sp.]|nr:hypothetical protein [uncultured Desulfobacter sp.]